MTTSSAVTREQGDWVLCAACRSVLYATRLARNLGVCPECGRAAAVPAPDRIAQLLDPGSIEPLTYRVAPADPLRFTDTRPYRERPAAAREQTGLPEAVLGAAGTIEGRSALAHALAELAGMTGPSCAPTGTRGSAASAPLTSRRCARPGPTTSRRPRDRRGLRAPPGGRAARAPRADQNQRP